MYGTLFTIPGDALDQIGNTSGVVFTDLFPLVGIIGGIFLAIGVAALIIRLLIVK